MNPHPEQEELSAFVDGELHDAVAEQHIASCAHCARVVDALRATVADLHALPVPSPSDADLWAIKGAVSRARKRPERIARWSVASGSAAALMIGLVVLVSRTSHPNTSAAVDVLGKAGNPIAYTVDDTNYNSTSAADLLAAPALAFSGAQSTALGTTAGGGVHGAAPAPEAAPSAANDARKSFSSSNDAQLVARCDQQIRGSATTSSTVERAIVARYGGVPSILYVYSSEKTRELWVVRRSDCYVELFRQQKK